jgi:hypothetical protein
MRALKFFLPGLTAILLSGCAGYHLGPANGVVAGNQSIEVLPFNNQTLQPRLGEAITQALRERLQIDGTYHLATDGAGDVVVTGSVRQYDRQGLGYLNTDAVTPENFQVNVTVHVIARERATGKLILDKDVKGHTLVNIGSDLASAERQALPLLAEDLSQNIAELLTEGAW